MLTLKQTLSHVLIGQKGGQKRVQIVQLIKDRPYNINQLAVIMKLNYRTVKHHIDALVKSGLIVSSKTSGYGEAFFISHQLEENYALFEDLIKKTDITSSFTFFQNVVEQTNIAVILIDKEGETFFWNTAAETLFGYKLTEVIGKSIQIFHYSKPLEEMVRNAIRGKKSAAIDTIAKHKSGKISNVNARIDPIRETDGSIIGYSILAHDITEQKRAEKELRSSEERLKELFKNTLIGIYQTTPEGKILLANPALIHMLGFSSLKELSQRDLEKEGFAKSVSRIDFKKRIERKGQVVGFETSWIRKDGSIIHVRENATAVRDAYGKVVFYCGTIEDLSQQKLTHEALHESRFMFNVLASMMLEAVIHIDLDGTILYSSKQAYKMYGYANEKKMVGKKIHDLIAPEDHKKFTSFFVRVPRQDTVRNLVCKSQRKGGTCFQTIQCGSIVRDSKGTPHTIILIIKEKNT
jgi:PAS domain S-box-containing protein